MTSNTLEAVWNAAQRHSDGGYRFLDLPAFWEELEQVGIDRSDAREALEALHNRGWLTLFIWEEGIDRVLVRPERYPCPECRLWVHVSDDPEEHIDICLCRQRKLAERGIGRMTTAEWKMLAGRP